MIVTDSNEPTKQFHRALFSTHPHLDAAHDPYILTVKDIELMPGLNLLESVTQVRETHGWRIASLMDIGPKHRFEIFSCDDSNEIMCTGAAVGLDENNIVRHFWPGKNLRFLGLLRCHLGGGQALVITRGHVVINGDRWANAVFIRNRHIMAAGEPVYVVDPKFLNLGSLSEHGRALPDGVEIGKLASFLSAPGTLRCAIVFKRWDDTEPLDMSFRTGNAISGNLHYHDMCLHDTRLSGTRIFATAAENKSILKSLEKDMPE